MGAPPKRGMNISNNIQMLSRDSFVMFNIPRAPERYEEDMALTSPGQNQNTDVEGPTHYTANLESIFFVASVRLYFFVASVLVSIFFVAFFLFQSPRSLSNNSRWHAPALKSFRKCFI